MGHQTLHVLRVELARDEDEAAFYADETRSWRNELRHALCDRRLEQMSHFHALGLEILGVMRIRFAPNRYLLDHLHAVAFETDHFLRIIGQEAELAHPKI